MTDIKMFNIFIILVLIETIKSSNGEYYSSLTNGKLEIHHNEMTTEMKDHAIVTTIEAFDSSEDYNKVAKTITNVFDQKYGGVWNCLLGNGNGNIFGFQLTYESGAYISLSIGQVHVTLFQIKSINTTHKEMTTEEVINEAKHLANFSVNFNSNLDKSIESKVVETIVEILKLGSTAYQDLASKVRNALILKFGDSWSVVIGRDGAFDFEHPSNINGSLNLLIGKLYLLAYHIKHETCVEKHTEKPLTQYEIILKARNSTKFSYEGKLLENYNDGGVGMLKEVKGYTTEAIKTYNTFYDIAHSIAGHLSNKTMYNTLPNNWFVFLCDSANGINYSPGVYAFIRLDYGPLQIAIFKTAY